MTLLGAGALVFWHDVVEGGDVDDAAWYPNQHLIERVGSAASCDVGAV